MRDREILVTRLIKASNKSSSSSKPSSPNLRRFSASSPSVNLQNQSPIRSIPTSTKLAAAQTELQACETHLAAKEKELSHRRFQVIRDGLTLRGRALADTGRAWTDLGLETLTVLERELGLARPGLQLDKPLPHRESPEASSYQHHSPSPSIHSHPQQHLGHRPFPGSFEHFDSSESRLSSPSPYRRRNSIHIPAAHAIHSEIDVPIPIMSSNNTSPPASTVEVQNSRQRGSSRPQSFSGAATNMQRPQGQARSHLTTPALQQQQRVSMASTVSDDNEVWADASDGEHRGIHSETNSTTSHSHSHNPLPRQLSDIRERSSSAHGHEAHYPTEESAPPPISSIGAGAPFGGLAHEQLRSHSPLHHVSDTPSRPSSSRHSSAPAIPLAIPTAPGSIFHSEEYRSFRESSYGTPQVNGVSKSRSEASSGSSHIRGAAANAHNDRTGASTPDSVSEGEVYTGTRVRLGSVSAGSSEQQPPSHALPQSQGIAGNPMLEALARETDRQRSTETLSTPQSPATLHARAARRSSIAVAVDSSGNIREIHVHEGTSSAVQSPSQGVAAPAATSPKEPTFEFQSPPAKLYEGAIVDPRMVGGHGLHRHDREDEVEIPTVSQSPSPLDEGEGEGTPAVPSIATATGGGTSGIGVSGLGQLVASTSSGTVQPETPSKLSKTQRKKMKRREKERAKAQQTAAAEQDRSDISGAETETTKAGTFVSSTVESSGAPTQTAGAAEKQDEGVRRPGDVSTTEDEGEVERLVQSGGYTVVENRRFSGGARELERAKTVVVPSYAAAGLPPAGVKVPVATPARSATLPASTTVPPASTTAPTAAAAAPPALSEAPVIQTQAAPTAQNFGHKVKAAFVAPVGGPLVQVGQRKAPPVEAEPKPAEDVSTPGDAITSTTTGVPTVPTTTTATTTAAPATTTAISATAPTTAATTTTTTTTLATPAVPLAIADQRLPPPSTAPPAGSTGITPSPSKKEEKRGSFFGRLFGRGRSASAKGPSAPVESVHEVAAPAPAAPVEGAVGATRPVEVPPVQGTTAVVVEGTTQVAQPAVVVEETAQAAQPVVTVEEPPRESVQTPVGGAVPLSAEAEPALPPPIPVSPQVTDHDVVPAATTVQEQPLTQVHVREIHEVVQGGEVVERTEEERVQDVPVAVGQSSSAVVAAVEADDHIVQTVHAERPVLVTLSATRGSEQPIIVQPLQQQPEPVTQEQVLQPTTQVQVAQPTTQVQFAQPTAQAQVPQSTVQPQVSQQQPPAQQAAPPPAEAVPTEPRLHQVSEEATTTPAKLSKKDRKAEKERQKAAEKEQKEREKAAEREQKEREKAAERERKERERMERERTRPEGSPSKHQQGHGFLGGLKGFFGADLAEGGGTPSRREMRGLAGGASGGGSQAMPPVHPEAYTSTEGATTTWVPSSHPALQATTPSHSVHTTPTNTAERAKVQESPSKRGGLAALFGRGHARSASTTDVGLPFSSSLLGEDASDENAARRYIVVENKLDFSSRLASSPPATSTPPKVRSKGGMERRQVGGISPSKRTTLPAAQYHPPPVEDSSPFAIAHAPAPLDIEQLQAQARSQLVSGHSRSQSSAAALGGGGWTTRTDKNLKRLSKGGEGWDSDGGEMRGFISNVGGGTARIEPAYEPVVIRDDPMPLRPVDGMKRKHVSATQSIPLASSSMTNIPASASVPVTDLDRAASPASGPARKLRKANKGGAVPVATSTPPMAVPQAPPIPSTREVHHSQIARGAHMPPVPQAPPAASTSTAVPFPEPVPAEHRSGYGSDDGGTINRKKSLGGQQKTRRTTSMSVPPSGGTFAALGIPCRS
ncbi:hypothetical protein CC2G_004775 [Coprinopsis cinerea AmutBmut pab1-1]|nr:hypothetical protein CC2G_004775 [Coprinopsis cinerea AmutBmut pab1-1]